MREFLAGESDSGNRVDIFVASKYPAFTRSSLEALFERDMVKLNGVSAKAAHKLKLGDKIQVDESLLNAEPPPVELPVIYEDDDVAVINKPAGVLTHSKGALNLEGTVASFITPKLHGFSGTNRDGIVHRLDRGTSGVIITAKHPEALSRLQKQFSKRKAKKSYQAIVEGKLTPRAALIDAPIARNPAKPQAFRVSADGKKALTEYELINSFRKAGKTYSLVRLKPQTGRTHQLRVHLSYIGYPIVGDTIYGHDGTNELMLHAESLEITLPGGERRSFTIEIPGRLKEFMDA